MRRKACAVSIDLASGQVKLDLTTVTNGTIVVRGTGKLIDDATGLTIPSGTYGSLVIVNETIFWLMLQELWTMRGLDISLATFGEVPLSWQSGNGDMHPAYYHDAGIEWLRTAAGGLLMTCGLSYAGAPGEDQGQRFGLHGRAHHLPASQLSTIGHWLGEVYEMKIAGTIQETSIFGSNLRLQRTIRSPANGVIAERYLSPGERVEEKPIARVATLDPLRVEVVMPAPLFGSIRLGATMVVTPEMPDAVPREAKVVLVDQLIDGPSNTFRARLELPNSTYAIPAGLRCRIELVAEPPSLRIDRNIPQVKPDGAR